MASMDIGGSAELFAGSAEAFDPLEKLLGLITGSLNGSTDEETT